MTHHMTKHDSWHSQWRHLGNDYWWIPPCSFIWLIHFSHMTYPIAFLASLFPSLQTTFYFYLLLTHLSLLGLLIELPGWLIDSSLFPFLYLLFSCFVIQLTQLPTKHITLSHIVVAWGFVYKGLCLACNNNNKFTQKSKFESRLVLESLVLSICQVKSHLLSHSNTWQSHHMSHSFIYVKFTLCHRPIQLLPQMTVLKTVCIKTIACRLLVEIP